MIGNYLCSIEAIKALVFNKDNFLSEYYFSIPEDAIYPELPKYTARYIILCYATNAALYEQWANDELRILLEEMLNRGEDIPDVMNHWAYRIATQSAMPARRRRSSESLRYIRMQACVIAGRQLGFQRKLMIELLCQALNMKENSVNSALHRAKKVQEQIGLRVIQGSVQPAIMWSSPSEEGPCSASHQDKYT